jgi:hypothetical protein
VLTLQVAATLDVTIAPIYLNSARAAFSAAGPGAAADGVRFEWFRLPALPHGSIQRSCAQRSCTPPGDRVLMLPPSVAAPAPPVLPRAPLPRRRARARAHRSLEGPGVPADVAALVAAQPSLAPTGLQARPCPWSVKWLPGALGV